MELGVPEQDAQGVSSQNVPEIPDSELSDAALMVRVCDGGTDALASLFRRYARLVRSVALRILQDGAEADDLLQEVFLFIQRQSGVFDSSKSSARSWIVQMTYHRAIDRRRYLQSRHFYTRVDLNGATEILARGLHIRRNCTQTRSIFGEYS